MILSESAGQSNINIVIILFITQQQIAYFILIMKKDKNISQIAVYQYAFYPSPFVRLELPHASVHIFVDGLYEVWEYGRDGQEYHLRHRKKGKYLQQQLITSCKVSINYSQFIKFSEEKCFNKIWGFSDTKTTTNCQQYVFHVLLRFVSNVKCIELMEDKLGQWNQELKKYAFQCSKITYVILKVILKEMGNKTIKEYLSLK